jgi:hypothetical protein
VGSIPFADRDLACEWVVITTICAKMIVPLLSRRPVIFNSDAVQDRPKSLAVMEIGSADDEGQRDATGVYQQVALHSFFSPGRSDSHRLLPRRGAP